MSRKHQRILSIHKRPLNRIQARWHQVVTKLQIFKKSQNSGILWSTIQKQAASRPNRIQKQQSARLVKPKEIERKEQLKNELFRRRGGASREDVAGNR